MLLRIHFTQFIVLTKGIRSSPATLQHLGSVGDFPVDFVAKMAQAQDFPGKPASLKILDELCRNEFGSLYACQLDGAPLTVRRVKRALWEPVLRSPVQGADDKSRGLPKFKELWGKFRDKPHPNLLGLKEAYLDRSSQDLLLVSECCGQSLESFVSGNISQHRRNELCLGIARGVQYLHSSMGGPHGCLTLDDMFLSAEGVVQVGGLDLACLLQASPEGALAGLGDPSNPYTALQRGESVGAHLDVFTMGVVVVEVVRGLRCGRLGQGDPPGDSEEIKTVEIDRRRGFIDGLDEDHPLKRLVLGCLQVRPNRRPKFAHVYGAILKTCEDLNDLEVFNCDNFLKPMEARILLVGMGNAGKTTILYQLKLGERVRTIPTLGFNVETIKLDDMDMVIWDVGGSSRVQPLWRHYYQNTDALIFAIDSSDVDHIEEAKEVLRKLLEADDESMRSCPVMILANKQDLPSAKTPQEVELMMAEVLDGQEQRLCGVFGVSGSDGEGLMDAIQHLRDIVLAAEDNK